MRTGYHIYCHIPFCKSRCPYCYFTAKYKTEEFTNLSLLNDYVQALIENINNVDFPSGDILSVVFGGGTPSLLNGKQLDKIMATLKQKIGEKQYNRIPFSAFEVSPDTCNAETIAAYRKHGFNRVSLGIQSCNDAELALLGRRYKSSDIDNAYEIISKNNFEIRNLDLLVEVPGQAIDSMLESTKYAISKNPENISVNIYYSSYPGAEGYIDKRQGLSGTKMTFTQKIEVYLHICRLLYEAGYRRVDNTLFTRLNEENFQYERESVSESRSVLAFGPGAAGLINNKMMYTKPLIKEYIKNPRFIWENVSVEKNAFQMVWGTLNAYGQISNSEVYKLLEQSIEILTEKDIHIKMLFEQLQSYNLLEIKTGHTDTIYKIKEDQKDLSIVVMHQIRDNWGYQLVTALKDEITA